MRPGLPSAVLASALAFAWQGAAATGIGNAQITVVAFISARCPISNAYGDRLQAIYSDYENSGVRFLFLNPNVNESGAEIAANAHRHGFTFPVAQDRNSEMASKLGAEFTPEIYVLDKDGAVRYHGGIDDAQNPARVKTQSLRAALDAVLAGNPVTAPVTKAFGCTVKRPRHDQ
ncbi:MAG: alkyl hydroperoxide reductase/Thiol specific antioxidant/Mal allergen [Bryobacterales bacterium]|nr:alkyl hydroperoxide reductase/Thiol specific antioxidant/Mal allergen [Bryobacterales bacterium]